MPTVALQYIAQSLMHSFRLRLELGQKLPGIIADLFKQFDTFSKIIDHFMSEPSRTLLSRVRADEHKPGGGCPRAWEAQRIREADGFTDVRFLEGGLAAWPY
ncbi:MAG: hypothetical protein ACUVRC_02170 [Desulfotomaculales bacterium]